MLTAVITGCLAEHAGCLIVRLLNPSCEHRPERERQNVSLQNVQLISRRHSGSTVVAVAGLLATFAGTHRLQKDSGLNAELRKLFAVIIEQHVCSCCMQLPARLSVLILGSVQL